MSNFATLPFDIIREVTRYLKFKDLVEFMKTCKLANRVEITNLLDIPEKYYNNLSPKYLVGKEMVHSLRAGEKLQLDSFEALPRLKNLFVSNFHINDQAIKCLDLEQLSISGQSKISRIGHMTNLKHLRLGNHVTPISGRELRKLNLVTFVTNWSAHEEFKHMTNLRKLEFRSCQVLSKNLIGLNLTKLICYYNAYELDIPHMPNLRKLYCDESATVKPETLNNLISLRLYPSCNLKVDLHHCTNLRKLYCTGPQINLNMYCQLNLESLQLLNYGHKSDLNHMTNLKKLQIRGRSLTDNECIKDLNLEYLTLGECRVTKINHMTRLKFLYLGKQNHRDIIDLSNINLDVLLARNCRNIENIRHMSNLQVLDCAGKCSVSQCDIKDLNIRLLYSKNNPKVRYNRLSEELMEELENYYQPKNSEYWYYANGA